MDLGILENLGLGSWKILGPQSWKILGLNCSCSKPSPRIQDQGSGNLGKGYVYFREEFGLVFGKITSLITSCIGEGLDSLLGRVQLRKGKARLTRPQCNELKESNG